ncbi:MAG: ATP-grasp domain-containing protein [Bacteroidales bacterium]|nr:ATP-grasp domain-containing protein [Bacteroidales bacterium]
MMDKKSKEKHILVLDGSSSQCLPMIRSLYRAACFITIVIPHRMSSGYFSRYASEKLVWPLLYRDEADTVGRLSDFLSNHRVDLVMGLGDKTAKLLSRHKEKLQELTNIIVPEFPVFRLAADKLLTMQFCMEKGISCPHTIDPEKIDMQKIVEDIQFPQVVKPRTGVGSEGVYVLSDAHELDLKLNSLKKEYGSLLIQEYIPNRVQYTVEVFCDRKSKVRFCAVIRKERYFPVSGGTSSCSVTTAQTDIQSIVIELMEKIGWVGSANLDLIMDERDNTAKVIEINPRVGAMVRVVFESGIDVAMFHYEQVFGSKEVLSGAYKKGIILRNMLLELPWMLAVSFSTLRKSDPFFFSFFGRNTYYQNFRWDDPFISLGYVLTNIRQYVNLNKLRRKFSRRKRHEN